MECMPRGLSLRLALPTCSAEHCFSSCIHACLQLQDTIITEDCTDSQISVTTVRLPAPVLHLPPTGSEWCPAHPGWCVPHHQDPGHTEERCAEGRRQGPDDHVLPLLPDRRVRQHMVRGEPDTNASAPRRSVRASQVGLTGLQGCTTTCVSSSQTQPTNITYVSRHTCLQRACSSAANDIGKTSSAASPTFTY